MVKGEVRGPGGGDRLKTQNTAGRLTLLPEVNLKEMEGIPLKARKGYAALSIFRGSKLQNKYTHGR